MRILVAGSTGIAGSAVVPALVAAGHEVAGASRNPAKSELLRSWGATPVEIDLFEPAQTARAVQGHDVVCNLATHIPSLARAGMPGAWRENDRIRRLVSANLVEAALAADTARIVQESIGFVYPDRGDEWIGEEVEPQPTTVTRSALEAERNIASFSAQGRTGVVLRFAQFYGPGAIHTVETVRMAARFGVAPTLGDSEGYVSSIHIADLGPAVVAALEAPAGIYNVGDDEPVRRRALSAIFAEALGRPRMHELGKVVARLGGAKTEALARSQRLANASFRAATGWGPTVRSARDGWPPIIAHQIRS
jgi:nucleoside-diphosphate-sugar epimerase